MSAIKNRIKRLETAHEQRRIMPLAWPSIEAAAAAGVRGGFLQVGEILPPDEWVALAVPYMAALTKGQAHAIH